MSPSPDVDRGARKVAWAGEIAAVQPRIRLTRSFDERDHSYQGFVLLLDGVIDQQTRAFGVAVSELDHEKHQFCAGQEIKGEGWTVADPRLEVAELYRASKLAVVKPASPIERAPPPWFGVPPALPIYRERGHRRLSTRTYETACKGCLWGCQMPVTMIVDQWNPSVRRYRMETFCYGPLSCRIYKPGPTRKVPGRRGMSYEEEDWVDEDAVSHRGPDD